LDEHGLALSQLTFTFPVPLFETEAKSGKFRYKSERAAIKKVGDKLSSDSRRRLFGYRDLHEHHGYFISDIKSTRESATSGKY
jgi:hypothetical protein